MIIDPRFGQLAEGLTGFSTALKKGEKVLIDAYDVPDAMVPPPTRQSGRSDEGLNDRRGKYVARLKGAQRQKNQLELAFGEGMKSEARSPSVEGTEAPVAKCSAERLAPDEQWMERVCQRENLWQALKRVKGNAGSPGIDGMTVDDLTDYLKQHWLTIREQLLSGTYQKY